jgi:archaellum component FlaD/FlaE
MTVGVDLSPTTLPHTLTMLEPIARLFGEDRDETDETRADEPAPATDDLELEPDPPVDEPAGPDTVELSNRIDDLEDEIESTATSLSAIRNAQEETADSVEEVNDTVRQLAGIYDQVAAAENPFVDEEGANGVVDDAGTVSFDDLKHEDRGAGGADAADDETEATPEREEPDHGAERAPDREAGNGEADQALESWTFGKTEPEREPAPEGDPESSTHETGALVETVPPGYAGDLLVMEWLSRLMDRSGPAGALRAVEHYHDLGLVSETVRDRVVAVLGGPSLDVFVDPTRPHEPTIEEHSVSNTYLHALRDLED